MAWWQFLYVEIGLNLVWFRLYMLHVPKVLTKFNP